MLRLLFYLVVGYVVWKIVQAVAQAMSAPPRDRPDVFSQSPEQKKKETFKDIMITRIYDAPKAKAKLIMNHICRIDNVFSQVLCMKLFFFKISVIP